MSKSVKVLSLKDRDPVFLVEFEKITISGNSFSDNCVDIWENFLLLFKGYAKKWESIELNFNFNVYNTVTTRYISWVMKVCNETSKDKRVIVNWYYPLKDTDMEESGQDYKEMYEDITDFNLIPTK